MDNQELKTKYEAMLVRARRETKDASVAHWAAGFALLAVERTTELMSLGELPCFYDCFAGISMRRVPSSEQAMFKDGTGLVALSKCAPWEAAGLARTSLEKNGEVWICLRLTQRSHNTGGSHLWCCARVDETLARDVEAFWDAMSLELARAHVAIAELSSGLDERLRLDALVAKEEINVAVGLLKPLMTLDESGIESSVKRL